MVVPTSSEEELEVDDSHDEEGQYVEYDIAVYPSDLTLRGIEDLWNRKDISIPKFQRRFVWTIKQSSQLIESFLLGLPVPSVFFYIDDENRNLVIDGQQRILSIIYFFDGHFGPESRSGKRQVFRLQGLPEQSPYNKKKFDDLDQTDKRKLENSVLRAVNVRQLSPRENQSSMYQIFERLNTGGTPLRPQEIRNCVYSRQLVQELNELNQSPDWRKIIGREYPEKHQRDVEMILRVFAFWERWEKYEKPMKEFLNTQMNLHKHADDSRFKKFRKNFEKAASLIYETLGEKPFHVRGPINLAALDSIFSLTIRNIRLPSKNLAQRMHNLLNNEKYKDAIYFNTSDNQAVQTRMRIAAEVLFKK